MKFSLFIAGRLAMSKSRSFTKVIVAIAIASLALSITVMIISAAVISGFKDSIHNKIFGFWGHIHITDTGTSRHFDVKPIDTNKNFYQELEKMISPEKDTGSYKIKSLSPYIIMPCLLETKKEMVAGLYKAVDNAYDWSEMNKFIKAGSGLMQSDTTPSVIVSQIIANKLNTEVGKKIIVTFLKDEEKIKKVFTIKGIYNTGLEEYDERFIIGHVSLLQEILGWSSDQFAGIEVSLHDASKIDKTNEYIYEKILPNNMYSETIQEKFPGIFEWLKLQDINERVIILLMAVVAIINLITVLLILILERTKMVGILKSIGATNLNIRLIFIYHTIIILLFGILIGNVVGIGFCIFQQKTGLIGLDEKNYYLDTVPIKIMWQHIAAINLGAVIVCFVTLILPSLLISKIKPVRALRFD